MARRANLIVLAAIIAASGAGVALAEAKTLTLAEVEREYPRMNPIHIEKCDRDGDGLYNQAEQVCVGSIYRQMYENR